MMKKWIATLLVTLLAMSAMAVAETYRSDDLSFEFDPTAFEIVEDDRTDDETTVVLAGKIESWGQTYIRFYLRELEDGESFPSRESFKPIADVEVTQDEWNGYKDVFMSTVENEDGTRQYFFVAPVEDDDGEIEDLLTVEIGVSELEGDDAITDRDDQISDIVDTLKVDD